MSVSGQVGGKPVRLDEARLRRGGLEILEHGIEPLDVANLEKHSFFFSALARPSRSLLGGVGPRFLDEHMLASTSSIRASSQCVTVGVTDADGVSGTGEVGVESKTACFAWRQPYARFREMIEKCGQFQLFPRLPARLMRACSLPSEPVPSTATLCLQQSRERRWSVAIAPGLPAPLRG